MTEDTLRKKTRKLLVLPNKSDFQNAQLDLFQSFLCNSDLERDQLSNTLDLWDSVPRYGISRQAMVKMRTDKGFLDLLKRDFHYKGVKLKAIIQPARIEEPDGTTQDYYPYFPSLVAVSRQKLLNDPHAKWVVQFHPLVTQSIDALTYRQFNYHQMMCHSTQLARWLHKQLSLKFTFASFTTFFEIRYSTIKRDSALLEGYRQQRQAIAALDAAFAELREGGTLLGIQKKEERGARGKLEDVLYTLTASREFVHAMKAANKRQSLVVEATAAPVDKSAVAAGNR